MTQTSQPHLCTGLPSFAAEDPGGWAPLATFARAADTAGVDTLLISDHVVFGEQLEEYAKPEVGGSKGGKQPTGPDGHWLEPITTIAWLAGQTQRVGYRTNILLAALRRPVVARRISVKPAIVLRHQVVDSEIRDASSSSRGRSASRTQSLRAWSATRGRRRAVSLL